MAPATFSRGSSSRRTAIATGIIDGASPWSARPIRTGTNEPPTAATTEPTIMVDIAISIIRFLPYMSARRETIGIATAETSSVTVTSHVASA